MSQHEDAQFMRLFTLMCVALAIFCVAMIVLSRVIVAGTTAETLTDAELERIAPVGQVNTGEPIDPAAPAMTESADKAVDKAEAAVAATVADAGTATGGSGGRGQEVYDSACFICHASPAVGAPVLGNDENWAPRIAKGMDVLYDHAINGYQGENGLMPAKGGRADLSDDDVKAAVEYMVAKSGGADVVGGVESADAGAAAGDEVATEESEAMVDETAAAEEAAVDESSTADNNAEGKQVYDTACFICHASGAAGAPKLGDAAAWAPRIEQGMDVVYEHAIKGFMGNAGMMPPKGGRTDLSDEQVKAAVDYMVDASK